MYWYGKDCVGFGEPSPQDKLWVAQSRTCGSYSLGLINNALQGKGVIEVETNVVGTGGPYSSRPTQIIALVVLQPHVLW